MIEFCFGMLVIAVPWALWEVFQGLRWLDWIERRRVDEGEGD